MNRVSILIETDDGLCLTVRRDQRITTTTDKAAIARALLDECVRHAKQALEDR